MEKDIKEVLFRNEQVANAVNCFKSKLELIQEKNKGEFDNEEDIILKFNDYTINFEMSEKLSVEIQTEINQSFKDCLEKFAVTVS